MTYREFLEKKIDVAPLSGLDVGEDELNPVLKPHQRVSVLWALRGGRRALFARFGLGKTVMQLEWCRLVQKHVGGKALIVLPLNVKREFVDDAENLLHMAPPVYVRTQAEADAADAPILVTNYERVRDGDIDPKQFAAVSLDEAATLRSFGSKTYQVFLDKFKGVRYKLVNTATPSPNRYKELIHYAGFLEIMDTGEALTRFFKRDSTKANNLTLYLGREREFWIWCSSWGLFLQKPSDLGFSDEGYSLPPLDIRYHRLDTDLADAGCDKNGQLKLARDAAFGLQDASREKRESIAVRVAEANGSKRVRKCIAYGGLHSSKADWAKCWTACGLYGKPVHGQMVSDTAKAIFSRIGVAQSKQNFDGQMKMEDLKDGAKAD